MLNFSDFLSRRDSDFVDEFAFVVERTEAEIDALEVKDGKWSGDTNYTFNVEGDDCSPTMSDPCYLVTFHGNNSDPFYGVSIAFYRGRSVQDIRGGYGPDVFKGVEKAIFEYIKKNNPVSLSWSPVSTSAANPVTGRITNREGRKSVYEIMSIKSLFPEKYVSIQPNHWIRRDYYDKVFVPHGYSAVPEGVTQSSNPGKKKEALEKMRQGAGSVSSDNQNNLQSAVRRETEEERLRNNRRTAERRLSELRDIIDDPVQNPQGLRIDDEAWCPILDRQQSRITNENEFDYDLNKKKIIQNKAKTRIIEISRTRILFGGDQQLIVHIRYEDGDTLVCLASDVLKWKADSQQKVDELRKNFLQEQMDDPGINYEKIKIVDKVIFHNLVRGMMGAIAILKEVEFDRYGNIIGTFLVDTNDFASDDPELIENFKQLFNLPSMKIQKLNISTFGGFVKDTPEKRNEIKRELENNSIRFRQREEEERRRQAEEEQRRRQREEEERRAQERRGRERESEDRIQRGREERAGQVDTGGFFAGQMVRVTAGPFRGTIGRIVQFRLRPGAPAGQTPPTEAIVRGESGFGSHIVDVRLLESYSIVAF